MYLYVIFSLAIVLLLVLKQRPYWKGEILLDLKLKREIGIVLLLVLLSAVSIHLHEAQSEQNDPFEIGSLDQSEIDKINVIDGSVAGRWDLASKKNGKLLKNFSIYIIPLSLFLFRGGIKGRLILFFIYAQGYVLMESITGISKGLIDRYRPFVYRSLNDINQLSAKAKEKFLEDIEEVDRANSFFSGDTSITAFGFVFFAMSYSLQYSESKYKKIVWAFAIVGSFLVCYFRAMSGKHFPSDVLVGAIVGSVIAFGILNVHLKTRSNLK